jgi:hypothetical protein
MLKVKDKGDSFYTHIQDWFSLPPRLLLQGKTLSGKTTALLNIMLRDNMFGPYYKGEHVYIISPSLDTDEKLKKLIDFKKIPDSNLIPLMDEEILKALWEKIQGEYLEAVENKTKPENVIIIFDDVSSSGSLKSKKNGMLAQFACVGRHINVGYIVTAQQLTDVPRVLREQLSGAICYEMSMKQLTLLAGDHSFFPKQSSFFKMFNSVINGPRDFLMINYSAPTKDERFRDKDLKVIDWKQFL